MRRKHRNWKGMSDEELRKHYKDNFDGMKRDEIRKADSGFYDVLYRRGLIDMVPTVKRPRRNWSAMSNDELMQMHREKFEGMTRTQISRLDSVFVRIMRRRGLVHHIPTKTGKEPKGPEEQREWASKSNDEIEQYYKEHYDGMKSSEVSRIDSGFHGAITKRRMHHIFPKNPRAWKSMPDSELADIYKESYGGMTRVELSQSHGGLYAELRKRGMLHIVATKGGEHRKRRMWSQMSDDEIKGYFMENYKGVFIKELMKIDSKFYQILRERGLMDIVPRTNREKRDWSIMSDDDVLQYYEDNYPGTTRGYLHRKDSGLYLALTERNLLHKVPSTYKPKIKTAKKFTNLLDTDERARFAIDLAHGNELDFADIMVVMYEGRIKREDVLRFVEEPSIRDYLGSYRTPEGISDILEPVEELLRLDKDNVIRDIIYKRLMEYRREYLGTNPSEEQKTAFLGDLRSQMDGLGGGVA